MSKHRYDRLTTDVCNYDYVCIGDEIFVSNTYQLEHCLKNKELQRKIVFKGIRKMLDEKLNNFVVFSITADFDKKTMDILLNKESAEKTLDQDLVEALQEEDYDRCCIIRDFLTELKKF